MIYQDPRHVNPIQLPCRFQIGDMFCWGFTSGEGFFHGRTDCQITSMIISTQFDTSVESKTINCVFADFKDGMFIQTRDGCFSNEWCDGHWDFFITRNGNLFDLRDAKSDFYGL